MRGNCYSDQLCYFVCSVICINTFSKLFLEYVVLTNLTLTQAIYSVNNHHTVIAVLEEVSLKTGTEHVHKTVYYISIHMVAECKWWWGGGAKCMIISTSEGRRRPQNLLAGEKNVEDIPIFTYLGALINSRNDMDQSIRERTQARNQLRVSLVLQLWEP